MDSKTSAVGKNNGTIELAFRPTIAGPIAITATLTVIPNGAFHLELVTPSGRHAIDTTETGRGIITTSQIVDATEVGATWTLRLTNQSSVGGRATLMAAYASVPGDLGKFDHIVIVMMENRSFDHMLGYLRLAGRTDVEGIRPTDSNSYRGVRYPVHPLDTTAIAYDPAHEADDVKKQLDNNNGGFVESFAGVVDPPAKGPPTFPPINVLGQVMGYHPAKHVPTYDFLAREFAICDHWYSSLPSSTWPNRLYALCGTNGNVTKTPGIDSLPIVSQPSIFHVLRDHGVDWNVFYSDLPFALILREVVQDDYYTARLRPLTEFIARAAEGTLPAVTWIDPNFQDVEEQAIANDDHAPGDIAYGQQFIASIYKALAAGPAWSRTLLVVTYDEHGGFYDHVVPPEGFGVRVPALVASPWVPRGLCAKKQYDHTSILKTILERFCARGVIPSMTSRVGEALSLVELLSSPTLRQDIPELALPPIPASPPPRLAPNPLGELLRKTAFGF